MKILIFFVFQNFCKKFSFLARKSFDGVGVDFFFAISTSGHQCRKFVCDRGPSVCIPIQILNTSGGGFGAFSGKTGGGFQLNWGSKCAVV